MSRNSRNRKGFSLAEAMMATVVLGIAAAGVLLPFTSGSSIRAEGERRTLAAQLASDLMEKVISDHFNGIDIVAEYNYSEPQGHIVKDFDTPAEFTDPMYANFSRGVSCDSSQPYFIIITVWVKYNGNEIVSLKRLISE